MSGNSPAITDALAGFDNEGADDGIEVGSKMAANAAAEEEAPKPKPAARAPRAPAARAAAPPPPAADEGDEDEGDEDGNQPGDEDEGDEEGEKTPEEIAKEKASKAAKSQIDRLKRENREARKANRDLLERLDRIEKGLQPGGDADKSKGNLGAAPDPTDQEKYPLGHLDDRYIEDRMDWLAEKKASERADAALQRQQENETAAAQREQVEALLEKVDEIAEKGAELYDDFQETVVDAGLRGDYPLQQATFEAAAEAEHGAQILYELSQDLKEAKRVAALSVYGQAKFVLERDAEIAGAAPKPRRIPRADPPPSSQPRGASSRTAIRGDTDNLDDFGKAWEAEGKKSQR